LCLICGDIIVHIILVVRIDLNIILHLIVIQFECVYGLVGDPLLPTSCAHR
jgi:hypothetical protein